MSLEHQLEMININMERFNTNMEQLVSILSAYPSPIDEAVDNKSNHTVAKPQEEKKATEKEKPVQKESDDAAEPEHTPDDLAALAKKVLQADKTTNRPKIMEKLKSLGIGKVSSTPPEHIDEVYAFLEGLE